MNRAVMRTLVAVSIVAGSSLWAQPWERAHAHNDYEHERPLLDALDHGFCSVEADIHLVEGALLVAHDLEETRPGRTLQALYLDPLRERVERHGGRVHPGGPEFTLLIDIKTGAEGTCAVLEEVLGDYATMLTRFEEGRITTNAVRVILSGNRPIERMMRERTRLAAIDGRLPDLRRNPSVALVPLVSDNWQSHFEWRGEGAFPAAERERLRTLVREAHAQGRRIRFWATPDVEAAWRELWLAGVDLINTDDLAGLDEFLSGMNEPEEP
jgi:hypothetical protein